MKTPSLGTRRWKRLLHWALGIPSPSVAHQRFAARVQARGFGADGLRAPDGLRTLREAWTGELSDPPVSSE